jgi:hypothetical protein
MIREVRIELQDGTKQQAQVVWADLQRVELHFKGSWSGLGEDVPLAWVSYLAWCALKRTAEVTSSYDEWWPTIATFDVDVDDDEDSDGADPS